MSVSDEDEVTVWSVKILVFTTNEAAKETAEKPRTDLRIGNPRIYGAIDGVEVSTNFELSNSMTWFHKQYGDNLFFVFGLFEEGLYKGLTQEQSHAQSYLNDGVIH